MPLGISVDFNANIARFTTQIDRLSGNLDNFQRHAETMSGRVNKSFGALGIGFSVAGLGAFVKSGIDALDTLNDLSLKTGIAVEKLSGFQLVAKQSGTDLEQFALAANKLSINIARNGDAFKTLGITAKDPSDAFLQLADVFAAIEDPQQRAAFGAKVLGKAYAELAPLLSLGGAELRKLVKDGEEASGATQALAQQADQFNDTLEVMKTRMGSLSTIAGGSFASAFNNLVDSISNATEAGVTFNNVLRGIGNAFAHQESFSGVAGQLDTVNKHIDVTIKKINAMKNNGVIGGLLDDLAGNDINLEKNRLDGLYKQQEKLANQLKTQTSTALVQPPTQAPDSAALKKFIGATDAAGSKAAASLSKAQSAADKLAQSADAMIANLQRELALRDDNSEAARVEYDIINGGLKGITSGQAAQLRGLANEKDALARAEGQWAALVESANAYYDLQQSNQDLINSGGIQSGFNDALAKTQDQLKLGTITADQAAAEYTRLGTAYNDEFIDPAKAATDQLSEYSIQAARNMETGFANFLFDPFKDGLTGMLGSFSDTIRRMSAEYLSSQLFEALTGTGKGGDNGWLGKGLSALTSIAGSFSAKGNIFNHGNLVPFAAGGIFDKTTAFPMANGKTGLLGEAGPEAIMPLSRGADGKLGIRSGAKQNVNITVNVQGGNNAPDVRRAAGEGARSALGVLAQAQRYG